MNHTSARILVVDAEASIRQTLAIVLRRQGYHVGAAVDSAEAAACLQHDAIDLLILEIYLPSRMNGLALAHHARVNQPDAAVLILTGSHVCVGSLDDVFMPPFAIMCKTASPQDVVDRVATLLVPQQERFARTRNGSLLPVSVGDAAHVRHTNHMGLRRWYS